MNTKFLGLEINSHINVKNQTEQMIPKLSAACYADRLMVRVSNSNILKSISCAYFRSIIKYGTIIWGNSSNSGEIFTLKKEIVRRMVGAQPKFH
jgi:hypothetical protein